MRNIDLTRLRGIDHHMDRIIGEYLGNRIFYEVNQINRMTQRCIQRWSRMFRDYEFQIDIPKPNDQTMDIEYTFSCKIDKDTRFVKVVQFEYSYIPVGCASWLKSDTKLKVECHELRLEDLYGYTRNSEFWTT